MTTAVANIAEGIASLAVPLDRVEPMPGNPRRGDVDAVARSYERFGQRKPIVARKTGGTARAPRGVVIAGNHQLSAARQLGWKKIAVVWVDEDERTAQAFSLADNRTADLAEYDDHALLALLEELAKEDGLSGTGWGDDDVRRLLLDTEALADRGTAFLDGVADEGSSWTGGDAPGHPFFTVAVTVTKNDRDLIQRALRQAKSDHDLETSADAMVVLAKTYLKEVIA